MRTSSRAVLMELGDKGEWEGKLEAGRYRGFLLQSRGGKRGQGEGEVLKMGASQQDCRLTGRSGDAKERRGSTRWDGGSRQEGSSPGLYFL